MAEVYNPLETHSEMNVAY